MSLLYIIILTSFLDFTKGRDFLYRTRVAKTSKLLNEYDFVVVGGGSAGTLLASRLSEVSEWKVLLVEAGEDENFVSDIPAASIFLQNSYFNWKYKNEPQENACLSYSNKQCTAARGKVLGGTGVLNHMIYSRCHRKDYDEWSAKGNPGWSYDEVLPFFLKSEGMRISEYKNSSHHNTKGELSVERVPFRTKLATTFLEAGKELGHDTIDYNSGDNVGFSLLQVNMVRGRRCSGNRAFLSKASKRKNLNVVIRAFVTQILINPKTKVAEGIEFTKSGKVYRITARKEVILTAGVFNSPKLLMLSGVGPKKHLQDMGIVSIKDLPVGDVLRDHFGLSGLVFKINSTDGVTAKKAFNIHEIKKYFARSNGILTIPQTEAIGFIKTKYAEDERPDIEFVFSPFSVAVHLIGLPILGMRNNFIQNFYGKFANSESWLIAVGLIRPRSTGKVRLRSKNPLDSPVINANFLADKRDIHVLIEGIREGIKLGKTKAFAKYGSELVTKKVPECEMHDFNSDSYWECAVGYLTVEMNHQMGTCQMGPEESQNSVVNHELKVHGISKLRVADASVIPVTLSGHTNAAVYMIAEKAADMIKKDWSAVNSSNEFMELPTHLGIPGTLPIFGTRDSGS